MNNFEFISPTKIIFGKDEENRIGEILKKKGIKKFYFIMGKDLFLKLGYMIKL
ncbi:MAG: hypothetical protein ACLU5J_07230 [Christensenellales bacterium]